MKLTQAILPVAGLGTRFLPWTKVVPKELLPLGNQPIVAHIVDECLDAGITDICFVINRGKELIPQYFYEDPALEAELERRGKLEKLENLQRYDETNFHVVYQEEQHGDGHAILQAKDWVESDHIAVLFGDDIFTGAHPGLVQLADSLGRIGEGDSVMIALENVPEELVHTKGIVEAHPEEKDPEGRIVRLTNMVEKPAREEAPSTLGIVGRYIIPRSTIGVLDEIEHDGSNEIRLIDALIRQKDSLPIYGIECEGKRLDTGNPEGYQDAVKHWQS